MSIETEIDIEDFRHLEDEPFKTTKPITSEEEVTSSDEDRFGIVYEIVPGLFTSETRMYVKDKDGEISLNGVHVPMGLIESFRNSYIADDFRNLRNGIVYLRNRVVETIEEVAIYVRGWAPREPSPKHGLVNNSSPAIPPDETPLNGRLR